MTANQGEVCGGVFVRTIVFIIAEWAYGCHDEETRSMTHETGEIQAQKRQTSFKISFDLVFFPSLYLVSFFLDLAIGILKKYLPKEVFFGIAIEESD